MTNKETLNFFFELGQLAKTPQAGWKLAGVENPPSTSAHVLRSAQMGYILAKMENFDDPTRVVTLVVFHDIDECRLGDIHKVANRYLESNTEQALKDQLVNLGETGQEIFDFWQEADTRSSQAGNIAKDAQLLEQALTAKQYLEQGYSSAQDWINNVSKRLKTQSAIDLLKTLPETNSNDWWQGVKKIHTQYD